MVKEKFLNLMEKYSDDDNYNLECWNEIEHLYTSKSRFYHNLEHLENMLTELDKVASQIKNLDVLLFAIFYHDSVYKPTQSDNEHQSALLFEKRISKTTFNYLSEVIAQIKSTKEHYLTDDDTNILLDLDLSILGKNTDVYKAYCEKIRNEYQFYPDFLYRKMRIKFLKTMLDSESIYKTDFFKHEYEIQARENLQQELNGLK